ncbi:hypothetical protein [Pseudodonghicola xiamenensis]|uniref:hypothetical protein n=1 Tax=Pseudodonghicola xiamenensis TaxID=337702 RepID=UPI0012B6616B|nr:hypothetical protein [Pseudodonghicola xiamenensis]
MTFRVEEQDGEEISFLGFDDPEFCHEQALLAYPEHRRGMLAGAGSKAHCIARWRITCTKVNVTL